MKLKPYIIVIAIVLSACSTTYVKDGASNTDFQRDHNDCLVKAGQAGFMGGDFNANISRNKFINQCLMGQGWTKQ